MNSVYYRDAVGAILVYDITDRDSFEKVRTWVEELRLYLSRDTPIAIAGNKCDMASNKQVDSDEAETYATEVKAKHFYTSAKTGKGIEELFYDVTKAILRRNKRVKKKKDKRKSKKDVEMPDGHQLNMGMGEGGYGGI